MTQVGLATDCHVETAVEDRRESISQHLHGFSFVLLGGFFIKRVKKKNNNTESVFLSSNFTLQPHLH